MLCGYTVYSAVAALTGRRYKLRLRHTANLDNYMLKLFAEIADRLPDSQDRGEMSDFPKKIVGKNCEICYSVPTRKLFW